MSDENVVGLPNHLWLWSGVSIIASCIMIVMVREIDRHTKFTYQQSNESNNLGAIADQPNSLNSKFVFPRLKPNPEKIPNLLKF